MTCSQQTTNVSFILRQLENRNLAIKKGLYCEFEVLEKAFDLVPSNVVWRVLKKLSVEKWLARFA